MEYQIGGTVMGIPAVVPASVVPEGMVLKHEGALYKGLSRYQHIERLGHEEVEGLREE